MKSAIYKAIVDLIALGPQEFRELLISLGAEPDHIDEVKKDALRVLSNYAPDYVKRPVIRMESK